jgi:hypothetical protein
MNFNEYKFFSGFVMEKRTVRTGPMNLTKFVATNLVTQTVTDAIMIVALYGPVYVMESMIAQVKYNS